MTRKINIHGIISMLLVFDATVVAFISIARQSVAMAGIYLSLFIAFLVLVSLVYCTKCTCRKHCNHLIMGWVSQKLGKKKYGAYTTKELVFGVVLPFLPVLLIPQFYLYHHLLYLVLYWVLFAIAAVEINLYVCRGCRNTKCRMCRPKPGTIDLS